MKKLYPRRQVRKRLHLFLASVFLLFAHSLKLSAQAPALPVKGSLIQTLLSNRSFTNGTATDTVAKRFSGTVGAYTLEMVAKINSATGRGLDIEGRDGYLKGFRLSLDAANLKNTSSLSSVTSLTASQAATEHTIRVAVKGDSAHIYQNGTYIQSQSLSTIKDIAAGVETDNLYNASFGPNGMANWAGTAPNNTGKPSDYGWILNPNSTTMFANANQSVTGSSRYVDPAASAGYKYNNVAYTGRVLYTRWDGNGVTTSTAYAYPVTLDSGAVYDFSMLYTYNSNGVAGSSIVVGIGTTSAIGGRFASKTFTTSTTALVLKKDDLVFTAPGSGTYYITISGPAALYSIAELSLNKLTALPRFIFGKDYPTGAVDMQIVSATYDSTGAFAPAAPATAPRQSVSLSGASVKLLTSFNTDFVVPGKTDVHFAGENTPYANSSIDLQTNDSWLFFDNIRPAKVLSNWLSTVTVNGAPAINNSNVRIAIYKNGTAVIPNGNLTNAAALTVFTQPSQAGTSQTYPIQTIFNNLGSFDNAIRSFTLKRGYMATFANNANGSGYSRVFIANDSDLVMNAMPAGLDTTASFIRVMQWNWPSKKGKAGWSPEKIGATWYYDWNIAGGPSANYEYQGIRQTQYWPDYNAIANKGVNHISGFNEPDRPDQSNLTVDQAFAAWPGMYAPGIRVGSPSPANPESSWITQFLAKCDSANYRVDYVTIHCYWGGQTPQQWYSRLLNIYNRVKRPLWITEWNNGANWTTESWPSDVPSQLAKQLADMKGILQVLDTASFIERYAEYDWVENKRALVLADTLTPAGKYYFASKSDFAYNPAKAFVHNWKLMSPLPAAIINSNDYFKAAISWRDVNGETGAKYLLERKIDGRDAGFVPVQYFDTYAAGDMLTFNDSVYDKATYRVRAYAKDTTLTFTSATLDVVRDAAPAAPSSLTGTVLSSSRAQINWNTATAARSYNLKRSLTPVGPWDTVSARNTGLAYLDSLMTPATTYYYVVSTLNSAGESANSTVLTLTTPPLVAPTTVRSLRVASGDAKVTLTWGFQYDSKYKVLRSATENGTYDTIATGIDKLRYVDSGRTNNTTYYYKVVAYNEMGFTPLPVAMTAKPMWGRQAYVSFNDTATGMAEDIWGAYHAVFASTAVRDTTRFGTGIKLDGTANAYATLGEGVVSNLNDFTISAWYKPSAISTWMRVWDFGNNTSQYMFLTAQAGTSSGASIVRYGIKNGGSEYSLSGNYTFPLGTWTHMVVSQRDSVVKLYLNGVLVNTGSGFYLNPSDLGNTKQNYVGKSQWPDPMLNGVVDELQIYNYALSDADVFNLSQGNPVILPITLSSFTGKATAQGNVLNWKVNTTSASLKMELERGSDGRSFSPIYSTTASRIAAQAPFSFTDVHTNGTIHYYRLKLTDVDGKVTYSPTVAITGTVKGMELVGLYPTLVNSTTYLSISAEKAANIKLVITDMTGRAMQSASRSLVAGSNLLNVDASALANGNYTISVYTENQRMGSIRFVVSH